MDNQIPPDAQAAAKAAMGDHITIRKEWKFKVTDLNALAAARPELCVILSNTGLIEAEIRGGMRTCPGLTIYEEIST